jgi:hypothetical protein
MAGKEQLLCVRMKEAKSSDKADAWPDAASPNLWADA